MMQSVILGKMPAPEITETSLLKCILNFSIISSFSRVKPALLSFEGPPLRVKILGVRIKH